MWRHQHQSSTRETEYLEHALGRVFHDEKRMADAERTLATAAAAEPLIAEAYATPQSPPHHAEGPFMDAHLRRMLAVLAAICDGTLRLRDIEEFARLKGYGGEIDELEETLRERQAFFETFILCHDAAKFAASACVADAQSRGAELGFSLAPSSAWEEHGIAERALLRRRYVDLYRSFAGERPGTNLEEIEAEFFTAYGIRVHYAGHERMIHAPLYRALLARMAAFHRVPETDVPLLEDLIAHHLQPLYDFETVRPERITRYVTLANARGYDADDFIDLLQACLFLDTVVGSRRCEGSRTWQEADVLIHFFQSEHNAAPGKRAEKEKAREETRKRERNAHFRTVGLDGVALMELLGQEPGRAFGAFLNTFYAAIEGKGTMPALPPAHTKELKARVEKYYELAFHA